MQRCSLQHPDIECALVYYFNCSLGLPTLSSWVPFVPRVRIRQALSKRRQCLSKGVRIPSDSLWSLFVSARIASFHFFSSFLLFHIRSAPNEGEDCYALVLCYCLFALAVPDSFPGRMFPPHRTANRDRSFDERSAFINFLIRYHSLSIYLTKSNTFMLHVRRGLARQNIRTWHRPRAHYVTTWTGWISRNYVVQRNTGITSNVAQTIAIVLPFFSSLSSIIEPTVSPDAFLSELARERVLKETILLSY